MSDDPTEDQPGWAAPEPPAEPRPPGAHRRRRPPHPCPPHRLRPRHRPRRRRHPLPPLPRPRGHRSPPAPRPASLLLDRSRKRRGWIVVLILGARRDPRSRSSRAQCSSSTATLPPYHAADDFVHDLASANVRSAAASRLCARRPGQRQRGDPTPSRATSAAATRSTVNPLSVDRDGDRATVEYTIDVDRDATAQGSHLRAARSAQERRRLEGLPGRRRSSRPAPEHQPRLLERG